MEKKSRGRGIFWKLSRWLLLKNDDLFDLFIFLDPKEFENLWVFQKKKMVHYLTNLHCAFYYMVVKNISFRLKNHIIVFARWCVSKLTIWYVFMVIKLFYTKTFHCLETGAVMKPDPKGPPCLVLSRVQKITFVILVIIFHNKSQTNKQCISDTIECSVQ